MYIFDAHMTSIKVPPLGESIVEAVVSRWVKREGDAVAPGDTLVELETDKITVEVPSVTGGVLRKHHAKEGDVVKLDQLLAEVDEKATGGRREEGGERTLTAPAAIKPAAVAKTAFAAAPYPVAKEPARVSPAAQRFAAETGADLLRVQGSGRGGVISKADLVGTSGTPRVAAAPPPSSLLPPPSGMRETREQMSTRRKRMAEHLLESQHATAHLTTFNEIDMSAVEAVRGRVKERIEKEQGVRLSFMPFFVKAACAALRQFPVVNAQVDGDSIIYRHYVNMGIAVASEAGLVVPNVKDADRMGMLDIARTIAEVAKRARDGKLTMDDLTGGTFTITNGGVFGSLVSTPIINFPQVAILGLHKIQERPVAVNGKVEIRPMMWVALSYDHRVIEGQQAVLFLIRIKELMEDPALLAID
jgi:2-oxoglutarate dehydrogenase E2 component (dihydrolipoamide succinyltransferase)